MPQDHTFYIILNSTKNVHNDVTQQHQMSSSMMSPIICHHITSHKLYDVIIALRVTLVKQHWDSWVCPASLVPSLSVPQPRAAGSVEHAERHCSNTKGPANCRYSSLLRSSTSTWNGWQLDVLLHVLQLFDVWNDRNIQTHKWTLLINPVICYNQYQIMAMHSLWRLMVYLPVLLILRLWLAK